MSIPNIIKINNVVIKRPTDFKVGRFRLTKSGRLTSGYMVMDYVGSKRKFFFTYAVISGKDLDFFVQQLDGPRSFHKFEWVERGQSFSCTVYSGELNYTRFRMDGIEYWKDFTFDLIEQ